MDKESKSDKDVIPYCPECKDLMILRTARSGRFKGNQFWGCSNYPKCKTIVNISTSKDSTTVSTENKPSITKTKPSVPSVKPSVPKTKPKIISTNEDDIDSNRPDFGVNLSENILKLYGGNTFILKQIDEDPKYLSKIRGTHISILQDTVDHLIAQSDINDFEKSSLINDELQNIYRGLGSNISKSTTLERTRGKIAKAIQDFNSGISQSNDSISDEVDDLERIDVLDPSALAAKIEIDKLKRRLLQTGNSRSLLNLKHNPSSRSHVRIVDSGLDNVWKALLTEKDITLLPVQSIDNSQMDDEDFEQFEHLYDQLKYTDKEYSELLDQLDDPDNTDNLDKSFEKLERQLRDQVRLSLDMPPKIDPDDVSSVASAQGIDIKYDLPIQKPNDVASFNFQTLHFRNILNPKLSAIERTAKSSLLESGVSSLYICLGFLEWIDPKGKQTRLSPLILQPISIKKTEKNNKDNFVDEFTISKLDEEPVINPILESALREHGISLPYFELDKSVSENVSKIQLEIIDQAYKDWKIRNFVTLGIFSSTGAIMAKDLEDWPETMLPETHPSMSKLLGEIQDNTSYSAENYDIDDDSFLRVVGLNQLPKTVLSADSSQFASLVDAHKGENLVIQGPPGTGKSQTITNIIASLLDVGKTVLFVAEKKAALDVVKSRLEDVGLGAFILPLHSDKANRKDLYDSLKNRINLQVSGKSETEYEDAFKKYVESRQLINKYGKALNELVGQTQRTAYEHMGIVVNRHANIEVNKLSEMYSIPWNIEDSLNINEDYELDIYTQLSQYVSKYKNNFDHSEEYTEHYLHWIESEFANLTDIPRLRRLLEDHDECFESFLKLQESIGNLLFDQNNLINWDMDEKYKLSINMILNHNADLKDYLEFYKFIKMKIDSIPSNYSKELLDSLEQENIDPLLEYINKTIDILKGKNKLEYSYDKIKDVVNVNVGFYSDNVNTLDLENNSNPLRSVSNINKYSTIIESAGFFAFLRPSYKEAVRAWKHLTIRDNSSYIDKLTMASDLKLYADYLQASENLRALKEEYVIPDSLTDVLKHVSIDTIDQNTLIFETIELFQKLNFGSDLISNLVKDDFTGAINLLNTISDDLQILSSISALIDEIEGFDFRYQIPQSLYMFVNMLSKTIKKSDSLHNWNDYLSIKKQVTNSTTEQLLDIFNNNPDFDLPNMWQYLLHFNLMRDFSKKHEILNFTGMEMKQYRTTFSKLDEEIFHIASQTISSTLASKTFLNMDMGNNKGAKSTYTEGSLLNHQMSLKKPSRAIRDVMENASKSLLKYKPCFMMSPTSIAKFLPKGKYLFDAVIIDEASQMTVENALGGILRAKQFIIVGDEHQLPPTNFFLRHFEEEEEEIEESILEKAQPRASSNKMLSWHYRSRHEHLIAFSNHNFYDGSLITFPNPTSEYDGTGIYHHYVKNGLYSGATKSTSSSLKGVNIREADWVLQHAIDFMGTHPDRSMGIATMNVRQMEYMHEEFERKSFAIDHVNEYLSKWDETIYPFFIKNLETIQGDERDHIIISTLYGPHELGKPMYQRFGPINSAVGHRRLNVLFTRARERIDLFTSMTPNDIKVNENSNRGVRVLKNYLMFAETKLLESGNIAGSHEAENEFEESIAYRLRQNGFDTEYQVGVSGYRIDIGVSHKDYPYGFIAGIECDGKTYHSSRTARDNDILRQSILEGLGWNIYRVWSTDWFKDPNSETDKLITYLHGLLDQKKNKLNEENQTFDSTVRDFNDDNSETLNADTFSKKINIPTDLDEMHDLFSKEAISFWDDINELLISKKDEIAFTAENPFELVNSVFYDLEHYGRLKSDLQVRAIDFLRHMNNKMSNN